MTDDALERILLDAVALSDVVSHLSAENHYRLRRLCAAVPELVAAVRNQNPATLRVPPPDPPPQPVKSHGIRAVRVPGTFNPIVTVFESADE